MSYPMTNSMWVTPWLLYFCQAVSSIMSWHPMTNREWVTLLYLINDVSPHDQQTVSDTALFPVSSIVSYPMTNREWVALLYLINYGSPHDQQAVSDTAWFLVLSIKVSSYDQQAVSDTALFLVSSIMSHPMINRKWVTLLYFQSCGVNCVSSPDQQGLTVSGTVLLPLSHQLCFIPWQAVSDTALFRVSSIVSHPGMTNRMWAILLDFSSIMSHPMNNRMWVAHCMLYF